MQNRALSFFRWNIDFVVHFLLNTLYRFITFLDGVRQCAQALKVVVNTCLNNEVTIEELNKNLRANVKMASDNEQKLDELSRKLGV